MKYIINTSLTIFAIIGLLSCRPTEFTPKPKGYFRIELPTQHVYQKFEQKDFPFTFEFPMYAVITKDTNLNLQANAPYWINVTFPDYDATIYLSYKAITDNDPVWKLESESYTLSFKHDKKADYIKTPAFETPNGYHGLSYEVGGNTASAYQFHITDSTQHFLRGSLYFNVTPNVDSLKPAIKFLKVDMDHLVNTLQFK